MTQTLTEYLQSTFTGELTNALFIAVIFGLIIADLRRYLPIESIIKKFKIEFIYLKIILFLIYYIFLVMIGLLGVFAVVSLLWLIGHIT